MKVSWIFRTNRREAPIRRAQLTFLANILVHVLSSGDPESSYSQLCHSPTWSCHHRNPPAPPVMAGRSPSVHRAPRHVSPPSPCLHSLPGIPGRDPLVTALSPRAPGEPRCRAGSRPCGASGRGYGRGTGRITERCPRDARQTSVLSLLFDFAAKATPACIVCLFPSRSEGDLKAEGWPPCRQDTAPR